MGRLKHAIRQATPPALYSWAGALRSRSNGADDRLFGGYDAIFRSLATSCSAYAEFGVGQSTLWMAENTSVPISSVDSSTDWIARVKDQLARDRDVVLTHIDLGPLGSWGRPLSYEQRHDFITYVEAPFERGGNPDLILVDGRMRVACFLTTLLKVPAGAHIIFDDFVNRPHYHVVEEIVARVEDDGRQAHFIVPENLGLGVVQALRDQFLFVLD